jgi:hypothetical protein
MQYTLEDGVTECPLFRFVMHRQSILEMFETTLSSCRNGSDTARVPLYIPWAAWGPLRTRWFDVSTTCDDFFNITWGQRMVVSQNDAEGTGGRFPLIIYNFNPATVAASPKAITSLDPLARLDGWGSPDVSPFADEVWSQLPYVEAESPFAYKNVEAALMDEDRIVLLIVGYHGCN